eukprot:scaffold141315_cov45-Prasinocladus_malaysianus.AAC.1
MCDAWVENALVDALVELSPHDCEPEDELSWEELEKEMFQIHAMVDVTGRIAEKTYCKSEAKLTKELEELASELQDLEIPEREQLYLASPADVVPFSTAKRTRSSTENHRE